MIRLLILLHYLLLHSILFDFTLLYSTLPHYTILYSTTFKLEYVILNVGSMSCCVVICGLSFSDTM